MDSLFKYFMPLNKASLNMTLQDSGSSPAPTANVCYVTGTEVGSKGAQSDETLFPFFKELQLVGERTKTAAAANTYIMLTMCPALF